MRPTIADVARAAGVSKTTVSHALTSQGRINDETRKRILEAAERLGYRPNMMARGLRTARTRMIAIANSVPAEIADGTSDLTYYMTFAAAAARSALRGGYATILIPPDAEPSIFSEIAIDGAVLLDPRAADPFLSVLRGRHVPFVTVGREPGSTDVSRCVDSDMVGATAELLDHFAQATDCHPALILSDEQRSYSTDALLSYQNWVAQRGLQPIVVTQPERLAEEGGRLAMARILATHPEVDAVFVPLDAFAIGALQCLKEAAVAVPQSMQIATLDGPRALLSVPALTALQDNVEEYAQSAIALLLELLGNPETPARTKVLRPRLLVRATTARLHENADIPSRIVGNASKPW